MRASRILVIFYVVAGIGAIALCGRMIGKISTFAPEKIIYVRAETTNVFSEPSEGSLVLIELKKGDRLEYVEDSGDTWALVRNGPFEGYVLQKDTNLKDGM